MSDKQAQLQELAKIIDSHHIGCNIKKDCFSECGMCAAKVIYERGYRKKEVRSEVFKVS